MDSEKTAISAVEALRQRQLHGASESYMKNLMKMLTTTPEGIPAEFIVPAGTQPMLFMPYSGQPMMMAFPQGGMFNQSAMTSDA